MENKNKIYDFIVNPSAGGHNGKKIKKALKLIEQRLTELGVKYVIHKTNTRGHATELTRSLITSGATEIIAVGGDGTLHEVINGFHNFENVNFGIIPSGTGNDFAHAVGLSLDPVCALDVILNGEAKYTDFMQLEGVRGLNVVGMGVDVEVLKKYSKLKKKTKFGYTSCLLRTIFTYKCIGFNSKINEQEQSHKAFIACVANGSVFGGGIPICPVANPTDNKLDFVVVEEIKGFKMLGALLKLKKGKLLSLKESHHCPVNKIEVITENPVTVNVDGEIYDDIPFKVEIVSNALKLYR